MRPRDSAKEDAVVIFTAGRADEIQRGVVTINIFVPDIAPYDNGVYVPDGARLAQIERLADDWVDTLTAAASNYKISLDSTIQAFPEEETRQHIVAIVLHYEYYDDGAKY